MTKSIAIHWFRNDLRLSDNPSFAKACKHQQVLPIYIFDDVNAGLHTMGSASRWWLHHALLSLQDDLGGNLSLYRGEAEAIICSLVERLAVEAVYWNRCYEPWCIERDAGVKTHLRAKGVSAQSTNGSLLWEPWTIAKNDGTPYQVFTPFYRKGCLQAPPPRSPIERPQAYRGIKDHANSLCLDSMNLLSHQPWEQEMAQHWTIGEVGASKCLQDFINGGIQGYKNGRNYPAKPYVSRLSPHLHFGAISVHQIWHQVQEMSANEHTDHFCSELGWREFSYYQLYHHPELPRKNLQSRFDAFPWHEDRTLLKAWQSGKTGIPMVDAGMRELWKTGYMHNRVRMIAGSFLVKNLLLHWHYGERWFWDTLVDADLANNSASWQWIAGCGADAAPYFRIFNPVIQGQKFDPSGAYIRTFIPEIAALPDKYIFSPWEAPLSVLQDADIALGTTYPKPVIDLKQSRENALAAFQSLKVA